VGEAVFVLDAEEPILVAMVGAGEMGDPGAVHDRHYPARW
jgi:hypothetical protein